MSANIDMEKLAAIFKQALQHQQHANYVEAENCYRQILAVIPQHGDSLHYMGLIKYQTEHYDEAIKLLKQAKKYLPDDAEIYYNLGCVYQAIKQWQTAVTEYARATRLNPQHALAHNNKAICHLELGEEDIFRQCAETAFKLNPDSFEVLNTYANSMAGQHRFFEAIEYFKKAYTLDPQSDRTLLNVINYLYKVGDFKQGYEYLKKLDFSHFDIEANYSIALFVAHYESHLTPEQIADMHRLWGNSIYQSLTPQQKSEVPRQLSQGKIRVGYVSPDFSNHAVASFIEAPLRHHDTSQFEIFIYANVRKPDIVTDKFKSFNHHWRDIFRLNDDEVAALIKKDNIDVLVDLAGHTANNRIQLFALKPAPITITYLGYPDTTGLPNLDYRITDPWSDPVGETDKYHTETLIRLQNGFLCFTPREHCPPVKDLPFSNNGYITFGSLNNSPKINDYVIETWCEILKRVDNSKLILKNRIYEDDEIRKFTLDKFEGLGIDLGRIDLRTYVKDDYEHLNLYNEIDIALDTFPYNGTTTTMEALWMGVPVISLTGQAHVSRVSFSILKQLGLEHLSVHNRPIYIDKAIELANNSAYLESLRANLRNAMANSSLCDATGFTRTLEAVYAETIRLYNQKPQ